MSFRGCSAFSSSSWPTRMISQVAVAAGSVSAGLGTGAIRRWGGTSSSFLCILVLAFVMMTVAVGDGGPARPSRTGEDLAAEAGQLAVDPLHAVQVFGEQGWLSRCICWTRRVRASWNSPWRRRASAWPAWRAPMHPGAADSWPRPGWLPGRRWHAARERTAGTAGRRRLWPASLRAWPARAASVPAPQGQASPQAAAVRTPNCARADGQGVAVGQAGAAGDEAAVEPGPAADQVDDEGGRGGADHTQWTREAVAPSTRTPHEAPRPTKTSSEPRPAACGGRGSRGA